MGSDGEERNMVQRLMEILHDRPEHEIYSVLKECVMDPDEAVQSLLSQDTFHQVKSKHERRKEMREIQDIKSQIGNGVSNGGWSFDHDRGGNVVQSNSNAHGTAMYKSENVSVISSVSYSFPACQTAGETTNQQLMHDSDYFIAENRGQPTGTGCSVNSSTQPPTKSKSCGPIAGIGRPSVADIKRRGSLCNGSLESTEISQYHEGGIYGIQASSGHLSSVGCSASTCLPVATNGVGIAHHSVRSCEQMTSNGENTYKRTPLEDIHKASSLGKSLADQTPVDAGAVVLPRHLQALAADCSHLSFGTYNSRSSSTTTGLPLPNSSKNDSKMLTTASESLLAEQLHNKPFLIEMPEPPSTQLKRQQMLGAAYGNGLMSVVSDLVSQGSRNSSHNIIREPTYGSSYMNEGFPQYSTEMLGSLKDMQGNLLTSTRQSFRNLSVQSTCMGAPPMPLRCGTGAALFKSLSVSLPEQTPTPDTFLPLEPSSWASHGIHGLPHQLLEQPYSQQTNLLKQHVDLNSYRNFPQDYGPIPFHHSPGSIRHGLPQYKRDDLARNVAMSDLGSSVFGSLQGSNTLLGDFLPSPTVASNLSAVGYKDMLQNQIIKDPNHFPPQGLGDDGSTGWDFNAGAGVISTAREISYYNSLIEREWHLRHKQGQQHSWNYASLGNFSSYHSQVETTPDNQLLHSFRGITLDDGKDAFSKQRQFWKQPRY